MKGRRGSLLEQNFLCKDKAPHKDTNIINNLLITDHAAIFMEFCYRKMNCSLLKDDDYFNDITVKIPIWLAEERDYGGQDRGG